MCRSQLKIFKSSVCLGLLLCNFKLLALEFEPGIGVGLEYTDNAKLSADNQLDDLIAVGYIGAILREDDGPVQADIAASLNHHRYTKDTYKDLRYFSLAATAGWEMIKNRFDWLLRNVYNQRPINSADPNTPDNIQDSNAFTFGANIIYPISARQVFTLFPEYRNFYYEIQSTDNQQFSLAASWNYDIDNVSSAGWEASVRTVVYDEPVINDVNFGNISFIFSNVRVRSNISTRLGSTYVERENGQSTVELAGNLDWLVDLTGRSRIRTFIATDLTDSSNGVLTATVDPEVGDPDDIQITTDVVRSQVISLGYLRQDGTFNSSLTGQLRNLNYSESPNDRRIWSVNAVFAYPITALLSSGFYGRYSNTDFLDTGRIDNKFTIGGGIGYKLSRKLSSRFDIKYRNRDSTSDSADFTAWSVYASLKYGFGEPMRPTLSGGF